MPNSDVPTRTARRQEAGPKKRARPTSRNRPPSHDTVCRTGPFILIRAAPVHPDPGPACRLAEATADRAGRVAGRMAAVDAQLASTQVAPDQQVVARHTPLQSAAAAAPAAHDASGLKWMPAYKDAVATACRPDGFPVVYRAGRARTRHRGLAAISSPSGAVQVFNSVAHPLANRPMG
jgi:hypothetical protein